MNTIKNRDTSLDLVCGLLIIHMIMGHIAHQFAGIDSKIIFWEDQLLFFFMPWFFFKNGMYFKMQDDSKGLIKRDYKRYIVPFIVWSIIGEIFWCAEIALSHRAGNWNYYIDSVSALLKYGHCEGNGPLWFLLSLFIVRQLFNKVIKFGGGKVQISMLCISVIVANLQFMFDLNDYSIVGHTLTGYFCFACGYYLKDKQRQPHIIALAGIGLFLKVLVARTEILQFFGNYIIGGNSYVLCLFSGVFAVVLINNVVTQAVGKHWLCRPLIYVGQQSMAFYVTHWVLLTICKIVVVDLFGIEDKWVFFYSMLASCVFLPLIVELLVRKTRLLS